MRVGKFTTSNGFKFSTFKSAILLGFNATDGTLGKVAGNAPVVNCEPGNDLGPKNKLWSNITTAAKAKPKVSYFTILSWKILAIPVEEFWQNA